MKAVGALVLVGAWVGLTTGSGIAEETVATAVYSRVSHGYKREKGKDGRFRPEYYALANGGLIEGTVRDHTIERVTYPEVAEIAGRFLHQQGYHYAQSKEQATLLLVLNWGATRVYDHVNYTHAVQQLGQEVSESKQSGMFKPTGENENRPVDFTLMEMENRVRDARNRPNAKIIGYLDAINEADGIQRWAGGGDRYRDLLADLEEPRYYIVISAYDFPGLLQTQKKKLLWQTRVSVRSAGNRFDESFVPMFRSAAKYFGQDSGKLVRAEESKGTVEFGDLKFLGEAQQPAKPATATKP